MGLGGLDTVKFGISQNSIGSFCLQIRTWKISWFVLSVIIQTFLIMENYVLKLN